MTKRRAVAVVLAVLFAVSPFIPRNTYAGGIPVIDVASLTQAIQQVMHMIEQIEHMKNQLEVAEKELDRISGSRSMGGILHSTYDLAATVDQDEILEDLGLRSAEENGLVGAEAELYDEGNQHVAQWLGQSQKSLEQTQERFSELSKLVAKVNDCPDQKDILDLQARIQAEQALLQNETIKLSMLKTQSEARKAAHESKIQQALINCKGDNAPIDW
jgi:type IV secretion system protein VirB5